MNILKKLIQRFTYLEQEIVMIYEVFVMRLEKVSLIVFPNGTIYDVPYFFTVSKRQRQAIMILIQDTYLHILIEAPVC